MPNGGIFRLLWESEGVTGNQPWVCKAAGDGIEDADRTLRWTVVISTIAANFLNIRLNFLREALCQLFAVLPQTLYRFCFCFC